jgi:CRISPR-associated endonuclease/helicase Cas3
MTPSHLDQSNELLSGDYATFFKHVFGDKSLWPFDYQRRLADNLDKVSLINVPTGAGKTKAILAAWLWMRLTQPDSVGRRLVYCLPMRTLVEQTLEVANESIKALRSTAPSLFDTDPNRFKPFVLMGGQVDDEWELYPEREHILIGTQDMLISRALNRGFGMSRFKWPVHFGLLNNDCLWVYDEVQLMNDGLATTAQLEAFRRRYGTIGKCQSIWMSATLDRDWLNHHDFASSSKDLIQIELSPNDLDSTILKRRYHAHKSLHRAPAACRYPQGLADFVKSAHQPGTQTLIVVNTVKRAREVFDQVLNTYGANGPGKKRAKESEDLVIPSGDIPKIVLIHSRFRISEREEWKTLLSQPIDEDGAGRIIVATQVIEAGVDLSSRLLITDIAPFSSLVQRFGRCNRQGEYDTASIHWVDRPLTETTAKLGEKADLEEDEWQKIAAPYDAAAVKESISILNTLESASLQHLSTITHRSEYQPEYLLRSRDLIDLFDTTPDLSGYDIDISRFVRGGNDNDLSVAWRNFQNEKPDRTTQPPDRTEICAVPVYEMKEFLKGTGRDAWMWDALGGEWRKVSREYVFPGMTLIVDSAKGGYDNQRGWDLKSTKVVEVAEGITGNNESYDDDPLSWVKYNQTLSAHSMEARKAAARIIESINLSALDVYRNAILEATQHHDWGKVHPIFQATLHGQSDESHSEERTFSPHLAKSKSTQRHRRRRFRHELASALALLQSGADDLVIYLAACHHGKVRLSIRALPDETRPSQTDLRFARGIWDLDVLPETDLGGDLIKPSLILDLEPMMMGSSDGASPSWLERMLQLRNNIGVFRLAYLECIIRAADVQASRQPLDILDDQVNEGV